ncbi:ferredoxin--NADP reductase [Sandaracinobacter sp. RS1-74]|uniref:ferredoxin--NADP reductase n=1 Tax=Sandaracinobacteroides sayramensis TaxID=2913411 RepID=UPI001EDBBA10|nr:ferredoxin--NADP reductase [Sandaracinobacteroides sayramensis]MCG2840601.1 ferredoxin--NADP reductase [Sandaracinobacteroides sayramensis]
MSNRATNAKLLPPSDSLTVEQVTSVHHWSDFVFSFRTTRPSSFRFRAGEFVMIGLPGPERPILRPYSIVSPSWDEELEFHSIKLSDGPLTSKLQHIVPGDEIFLGRKPTGTLVLDALEPGRRLFLLSTGTGIAPFLSVLREPDTWERFDHAVLVHSVRSIADLAYRRELESHLADDPLVRDLALSKLSYIPTVTRETFHTMGRIPALIESGRLFDGTSGERRLDPETDRLMLCGSMAMLKETKALLDDLGFREGSNAQPGHYAVERAFVG